ncbi:30S ribosomal protein S4 chloroplastic [Bienertia sinuspersici]
MSRYRGPRFKKIRRLGALPGLTNKRPRAGSDLRNQSRSGKDLNINDNYLNTFVSPESQRVNRSGFTTITEMRLDNIIFDWLTPYSRYTKLSLQTPRYYYVEDEQNPKL